MQEVLTEDEIDNLVKRAHQNVMAVVRVTSEQSVVDAAAHAELRKVFEAGEANGKALAAAKDA